jgi:RimJ/RimL family protein N-acetyltransferase
MSAISTGDLLEGEFVRLTRWQTQDLPQIAQAYADAGFLQNLMRHMLYPETLEDIEAWYRSQSEAEAPPTFAVRLRADNSLLGILGLKELRWHARHTFFYVGIFPDFQRRGYGADAVRVMLHYAFMEMNLNCVALEVFAFNTGAVRLYEKLGFVRDGTLRAYMYRDGVYHDMHLMSLTRAEWEAHKARA